MVFALPQPGSKADAANETFQEGGVVDASHAFRHSWSLLSSKRGILFIVANTL